jgi:hypothetical protein
MVQFSAVGETMTIPKITDTREKWSEWLESKYPFAPVFEQSLCKRMPYKRAEPGTPQELDDLRGIRDREQAIDFAVMWARLNVTVANGWRTKQ